MMFIIIQGVKQDEGGLTDWLVPDRIGGNYRLLLHMCKYRRMPALTTQHHKLLTFIIYW